MPSKYDSSVAPEGHENIFIFVPIPSRISDTPELREHYTKKILSTIRTTCDIPDFEKKLVYQKTFSLKDFQERYNCLGGSSLGLAHTLLQTAVFRPNNISKKIKNLYYVGANTNPGIGLPMCLISAELLYQRLQKNK
jgi:phytoene desaturase